MRPSVTRQSLLSRVRNLGDHASWREFDDMYRDLILGYCWRRRLQQSDAEDVRQMVMLSLAKGLRTFHYESGKGRFRDYLGRATANAIRTLLARRPLIARGGEAPIREPEDESSNDTAWEQEWTLHHYRLAMKTVRKTSDPRSVEVFERLIAGEHVKQISETSGMTIDAVHKIKQRMRDRMREAVEAQIREENEVGDATGTDG